jgi:hypothetical protein
MPLLKAYAALASSFAMTVLGDWIVVSSLRCPVEAQSHQKLTHEMFDRWMTELSNWGRWARMIRCVR